MSLAFRLLADVVLLSMLSQRQSMDEDSCGQVDSSQLLHSPSSGMPHNKLDEERRNGHFHGGMNGKSFER